MQTIRCQSRRYKSIRRMADVMFTWCNGYRQVAIVGQLITMNSKEMDAHASTIVRS